MQWLYLSPHLDDAVYSCGALIAAQVQAGETVHILTICAGDPPDDAFSPFAQAMHARWGTDGFATVALRRREDQAACALLGASYRHADIPDCIYRKGADGAALYASEEALWGALHKEDAPLMERIHNLLTTLEPDSTRLVVPLTLGGHVDHKLVRTAALGWRRGPLWFYADYPYARQAPAGDLMALLPAGARLHRFPLSAAHIRLGSRAMAAYASQLPVFWADETALYAEMQAWADRLGGALLWRVPSLP